MTTSMIDRSACAARRHGTETAYNHDKCRCSDAREDKRYVQKRRRAGRPLVRRVPAIGTIRQLQALAVDGWPAEEIGARMGVKKRVVLYLRAGRYQTLLATTAARVDAVYTALAGKAGPSEATRQYAERAGWLGFDAWIDIHTDPDGGLDRVLIERALDGKVSWVDLDKPHKTAVVRAGHFERGLPFETLAQLLQCERTTPQQHWSRETRRAKPAALGLVAA